MRKYRRLSLFSIVLCMMCLPVHAAPTTIKSYLDNPQLVGEARLKVLLWNVFDASLYTNSGTYDSNKPFALSLQYLRSLDGKKIVSKSMEEIKSQRPEARGEQLSRWEQQLLQIIPDVSNGTTITGVRTADGYTTFYRDGTKLGSINDIAFTQAFFDIWLSDRTSEPKFRSRLLGSSKST